MLPACSRGRLSHLSKVKLVYRDPTESWDEYTLLKKGNIHKQSILNVICNPERSLNVRQPPHCLQAETLLSNASATKGMFLCRWLYQLLPLWICALVTSARFVMGWWPCILWEHPDGRWGTGAGIGVSCLQNQAGGVSPGSCSAATALWSGVELGWSEQLLQLKCLQLSPVFLLLDVPYKHHRPMEMARRVACPCDEPLLGSWLGPQWLIDTFSKCLFLPGCSNITNTFLF